MTKKIVNLGPNDIRANVTAKINKKAVRKLYWTFEADGGNTPLELLGRFDRAGYLGCLDKICLPTDKDGECKHDYFHLSCAGLDKFKVKVSLKPDGSGATVADEFEVWRQIHVSMKYMDSAFVPDLGPVKSEYAKHGTIVQRVTPPGGEKIAHIEKMPKKDWKKYRWAVTKSKQEARVLLVDKIRSETWAETVVPNTQMNATIGDADLAMRSPNFVWDEGGEFCRAKMTGAGFDVDVTQFAKRVGDREIRLEFPEHAPYTQALKDEFKKGPVTLKINVRFGKYPNGFAIESEGFIVIANRGRTGGPKPVGPRQGTMIHEMGHGFGLVRPAYDHYEVADAKPVASPPPNNLYYDRGSGGHCRHGAGGTAPNYKKGQCVMFHEGHSARPHTFCPECAKIVKRANLAAARMPWPST
ncbi:MAG: hypothetical protein HZA61_00160 [Candidatus Eisenbacteria bacterium]|uniref:Uncharacterized protein n=1 Tax=Eiseniibacteriota bacterium TaxID=2212470 RepID=A0A933W0E4_UNCEI|nr:hypothetical protein [Candidatus Eisenbacteria bacterium]